jgi:hypothetical protein
MEDHFSSYFVTSRAAFEARAIVTSGRSFKGRPSLLACLALAAGASAANPVVTFQGTGSDAEISFQFDSLVPLDTPGLLTTFSFNYCNVPAGESCGQVNDSAVTGVIRFVGIVPTGRDTRTFDFDSYIDNGNYASLAAGSPNSGTVTTGSTNATPEPSSVALAGFGLLLLAGIGTRGQRLQNLFPHSRHH